jgi:beta-mannosidase
MYVQPRTGENHLCLDGTWEFNWADELYNSPDHIGYPYKAGIPGSVFWNLYEAGVLPHPYQGCNSKEYAWVDSKVWYFQKKFTVGGSPDSGRAVLCFDGAAYYSRVWLNGNLLGDHNGMFGGPVLDVHDMLNFRGENVITVAIRAANYGKDLPPYGFQSPENKAIVPWNVVRDAHTSNGDFVVLGLWRSVRIEFLPPTHLACPYLVTKSVEGADARLSLEVEVIQEEYDEFTYPREYDSGTYDYTFAYQSGMANAFLEEKIQLGVEIREKKSKKTVLRESHEVPLLDYGKIGVRKAFYEPNFVNMEFTLLDAKLWNPVGLGDPFLYEVILTMEQNGTLLDNLVFDTGVRKIELLSTAGKKMRSRWDNFKFSVNGKHFFLKGVNWMPVDFLYREEEQEYRWILNAVKAAGIQMIRVWSGGGYPESECFYQLCNELGILVWQDSFLANMNTPAYPQDELQEQLCLYLYRLRNHPSLAVHCGGNEFNPYSIGNAASMFILERNIKDLDPSRHFKRTTPDKGSAHIYRDMEPVWYRHSYGQLPFVGESGIHSFPNAKSLRQLISAEEYKKPVSNMMEESFRDTHPELLNHFTEYVPERVPRMLARASAISDVKSADIETLALATQMASAEFYQIMIQSMRENYPTCGGMILWVLKRSWTTVGIQLMDGLSEPIAPYYYMKNAYSPVNTVLALSHLIYAPGERVMLPLRIINESGCKIDHALVKLEVFNDRLERMRCWEHFMEIPTDTFLTAVAEHMYELPEDYCDRFFFLRASIYQDGRMLQQSFYWPKSLKRMCDKEFCAEYRSKAHENPVYDNGPWLKDSIAAVDPAELTCNAKAVPCSDGFRKYLLEVENTSKIGAFPVRLQLVEEHCVQNPSDNFFFLPAGECREILLDCFDRSGDNRPLTLQISGWNVPKKTIGLN